MYEIEGNYIARSLGVFKLLTAAQFKAVLASPYLNTRYEEQVQKIWFLNQIMVLKLALGNKRRRPSLTWLLQVYDAVMDYVLVDTEARKKHLASLFEEIQWPFIRTPKSALPSFTSEY